MAVEQMFTVIKEYFPATLGAIIGAWNKRKERGITLKSFKSLDLIDKFVITILATFAITVGIFLGKWVSIALIGYYDLPVHAIPVVEFVTALNGIKIIDSLVKAVDKSLDVVVDKVPKAVDSILESITNRIKKWFE